MMKNCVLPHTFINCAKIKPGNSISRQTYFEISGLQRYFEERLPSRLGLPVFFLLKNPPTSNPASNMLLGFKTTCETVLLSKMLISVCNTWCSGSLCLIYLRNRWPVVLFRACFSVSKPFSRVFIKSVFWRIFLSWKVLVSFGIEQQILRMVDKSRLSSACSQTSSVPSSPLSARTGEDAVLEHCTHILKKLKSRDR